MSALAMVPSGNAEAIRALEVCQGCFHPRYNHADGHKCRVRGRRGSRGCQCTQFVEKQVESPFLRDDIVAEAEEYEKITAEYSSIVRGLPEGQYFTDEDLARLNAIERRQAQLTCALAWFVVHKVRDAKEAR